MEQAHQHRMTRQLGDSEQARDDSVSWSELQRRHRSVTGNTVRAGVLGAFRWRKPTNSPVSTSAAACRQHGARSLAESVMRNPATALDVMAREELGIEPGQLSPYKAAGSSALLFCLGAIVPLLPFAITSGTAALATSVIASALALFLLGALVTRLTGRSPLRSGLRQVVFGLGAATITYTIGVVVGLAVG
jgi:hypothetical protein